MPRCAKASRIGATFSPEFTDCPPSAVPSFRYRARDTDGRALEGAIDAPDRSGALALLAQQRLFPTLIEPETAAASSSFPAPNAALSLRLRDAERLLFTEQLGQLLRAGMRIETALASLQRRMASPRLKAVCEGLRASVVDGQPLSSAMSGMPRAFDRMYAGLIKAGEAGGALGTILDNLAAHLRRMRTLREQVSQALIYPAFLVTAGIGMILVFMLVMVPQLTDFFTRSGGTMPLATRILIATSEFLAQWGWLFAIAAAAGVAAIVLARRNPVHRETLDAIALRLPLAGPILTHATIARIARTLSSLLTNGLTLLNAIALVENASTNLAVRRRLQEVRQALANGAAFSAALQNAGGFPELFIDMTALGEQTGNLPESLDSAAEMYEGELGKRIRHLTALLPPILIIVIAVLAGLVVFSILSAVFDMTSSLRTRTR